MPAWLRVTAPSKRPLWADSGGRKGSRLQGLKAFQWSKAAEREENYEELGPKGVKEVADRAQMEIYGLSP